MDFKRKEGRSMVKQVTIKDLSLVKQLAFAARCCKNGIDIQDQGGAIADAKSILGLMRLDYSRPVNVVCENAQDLERVIKAIS